MSATARDAITDADNVKVVSPASYWELAIKVSLGKYMLTETYDEFIQHAIHDNGFAILPIEPRHTSVLIALPMHHKDPFDRLLVAQAISERMSVVSNDSLFDKYPIRRVW